MENRKQSFTFKEDKSLGFQSAVKNGQLRLALEYCVSIIEELSSRIDQLESKLGKDTPVGSDLPQEEAPKAEIKKTRTVKKEAEENIS